jgi:hypothetical protein
MAAADYRPIEDGERAAGGDIDSAARRSLSGTAVSPWTLAKKSVAAPPARPLPPAPPAAEFAGEGSDANVTWLRCRQQSTARLWPPPRRRLTLRIGRC